MRDMMIWAAALVAVGAAGCGGTGEETATETPALTCNTDWEDANPDNRDADQEHKEPRMYPGADCLGCHYIGGPGVEERDNGNGYKHLWTLAGTLFDSPEGRAPVEGATVEVTDADGTVITMTTNSVGNFYTDAAVTFPFTARVSLGEAVAQMAEHPDTGSCNACHRCEGEAGGKMYLAN